LCDTILTEPNQYEKELYHPSKTMKHNLFTNYDNNDDDNNDDDYDNDDDND
jgi:hypothetical protein